jgi:hypothetical protein
MSHDDDCPYADVPDAPMDEGLCYCAALRAAYQRGVEDFLASDTQKVIVQQAETAAYEQGYRAGYNDHARSRAYAEQVYGPYKTGPISESDPLPETPAGPWPAMESLVRERLDLWDRPNAVFNQHGKGENP